MRPRWLQPIAGFILVEAQHCVMQARQFANVKRRIEGSNGANAPAEAGRVG
jgi:hypothetical protein